MIFFIASFDSIHMVDNHKVVSRKGRSFLAEIIGTTLYIGFRYIV